MMDKETSTPAPRTRPSYVPIVAAALMMLTVIAGGYFTLRSVQVNGFAGCEPEEQSYPPGDQIPLDYAKWEKPLVAFVLSGQMHGNYDPCGCSVPQHGGLTRRYNFVQSLKAKNWNVVGIDLGELASLKGIRRQEVLKYGMSMKALAAMNYRAIGRGLDEMLLPLDSALAEIENPKKPFPRPLNISLADALPGKPYHQFNVRQYEIISDAKPKIGVISMMGPDLRDELAKLSPHDKFLKNMEELPKALKAFADAGVEIGVVLHHEYPNVDKAKFPVGFKRDAQIEKLRREQALQCAQLCANERKKNPKIPPIQLMMLLTTEPLAPSLMDTLDDKLPTKIVVIGHKGKYVGLLGVYPKNKSKEYQLRYQIVLMSPEWKTKEGQEASNPVTALLEDYNKSLKAEGMLEKFSRSPHFNQLPPMNEKGLKATFVGSERCGDCHDHAYQVWKKDAEKNKLAHSKATVTLESEKHPSGRHYDPECMMCHTTGFKHPGGYYNLLTDLAKWPAKPAEAPAAKKVEKHNEVLRGVGCESCHGPGSEHVKKPNDENLHKLLNLYLPTAEERKLEDQHELKPLNAADRAKYEKLSGTRMRALSANLCMKCHDDQNDVNFGQTGHEMFDQWLERKLIHHTKNTVGARPALKQANAPALPNEPMPPPVIEIIQDEKK